MNHQINNVQTPDLRIWRSPWSNFKNIYNDPQLNEFTDESITADAVYTERELAEIATHGFNGIWVHGLLKRIVKTVVFPEFGINSELHVDKLNSLIVRARKYGIKVYLYCQPPRGLFADDPFWHQHPDVGGEMQETFIGGEKVKMRALCTSTEKVKAFLQEGSANLIRFLPDLGGIFFLTASDYLAHCWTNIMVYDINADYRKTGRKPNCSRCRERGAVDVVAEVIQLLRDGIRSVSNNVAIIPFNWRWDMFDPPPHRQIIKRLPKDVILLANFECGGRKIICGLERPIQEYSLSYVGPSEMFVEAAACAKKTGLKVMAKLQLGTTHELATVPNLPLITNIYDKVEKYQRLEIDGYLGCWNFGCMRTVNSFAFNYFLDRLTGKENDPEKTKIRLILSLAKDYFGVCNAELVTRAWKKFSEAMDHYPFSVAFLHFGIINYALCYPLKKGSLPEIPTTADSLARITTGRAHVMEKKRGEILDYQLGPYTLNEFIKKFMDLYYIWREGIFFLEKALYNNNTRVATEEIDNVRMCYHVFRSVLNIHKVYKLRKDWNESLLTKYKLIVADELDNLTTALPLLEKDKRFGFHSEAFAYMFDDKHAREKIKALSGCLAVSNFADFLNTDNYSVRHLQPENNL